MRRHLASWFPRLSLSMSFGDSPDDCGIAAASVAVSMRRKLAAVSVARPAWAQPLKCNLLTTWNGKTGEHVRWKASLAKGIDLIFLAHRLGRPASSITSAD